MKPALLLVDLQNDFLDRQGLVPDRETVVAGAATLLYRFRRAGWPVLHIRMSVRSDGFGRMPHWIENGIWSCVVGTLGASPPPGLEARDGEPVFSKRFYSAFEDIGVSSALAGAGVDTVVVAGLYTHACVRATALDAYARGYAVSIASDAVASTEPAHAQISLDYLARLSIRNVESSKILAGLERDADTLSVAPVWQLRNPARWSDVLAELSLSGRGDVERSVVMMLDAQPSWARLSLQERVARLSIWATTIKARRQAFLASIVQDIGKPIAYAEAEFRFALELLQHTVNTLKEQATADTGNGFVVRHSPLGIVGIITPWNNPLAIPVGKLAPALAWGNAAVWKPALPAARIARLLVQTLAEAAPDAPVEMLLGDDLCGEMILAQPAIGAITFTGSTRQGGVVAALCAQRGKPLQAELGGNNAVLVMADTDVDHVASLLAPALFGFAGQRCTAPRRVIVQRSRRNALERALLKRIAELPLGEPADPRVQVGPLISVGRQKDMCRIVAAAKGHVLCGGDIPSGFAHGAWFRPTLIADPAPNSPVVTEESFGPVAIIMSADDADHGLALNDAVPQGLITTVFSDDPVTRRKLMEGSRTGLVVANLTPTPVAAAAPFCGWKSSGLGPPEHGRWDREFYSKPQAWYCAADPKDYFENPKPD
jgi:acyl-CoA reductase-like NAD-dependent aldehyde dehydrogenase/nicotinamidase-related amidase